MDTKLEKKINSILPYLNESQTRKYLASEAISLGRGGIAEISAIFGVHRNTISAGIKELLPLDGTIPERNNPIRVRKAGGGRKPVTGTQPGIMEALENLSARRHTAIPKTRSAGRRKAFGTLQMNCPQRVLP